ncbi:hypothetical protein BDZ91DRAFT_802494 [Kalaharituber pfeilii]|nr:hypothetical protein BDZ91DRAFT_802494 [Kalaharituber pfeilii]
MYLNLATIAGCVKEIARRNGGHTETSVNRRRRPGPTTHSDGTTRGRWINGTLQRKIGKQQFANAEDEGWKSIYTDGSRINITGARSYSRTHLGKKRTSRYLGTLSAVNDAELIAMSEALTDQTGELLIISDSKVAITKLQKIASGAPNHEGASRLVREKWEERTQRGDLAMVSPEMPKLSP